MGTDLSSQPVPLKQSEDDMTIQRQQEAAAEGIFTVQHKDTPNIPDTERDDIVKTPRIFRWSETADEVYIAGSFSNWEKIPLSKSTNDFNTIIELPEGTHEYKFYVDGAWRQDPDGNSLVEDTYGGFNNVITVNAVSSQLDDFSLSSPFTQSDRPESPEGEYGQEMPKIHGKLGPPIPPEFPKQLTQMPQLHINPSAQSEMTDQTVLTEEPSHVCLKHLYAISLKNCTVLATPQRYKDRFYTTLLYKPL
ncbi:hypothetical protein LOD99_10645 [Oopsacas minuta]|uniref:5'-AMP-activated protein kinase subunit beta-1 n=1 Tax=Oopsacas minuta TaxID=111878 RepID=A0AAV7KFW9_9METZ|nr:hypothetical protein LOD99_10645 [Oopsacas minuta]